MKKLIQKLFRKRRDPIAELRREPTTEETSALRLEKLAQDRLDILREGSATLHDLTNVAYGTPGYAARSLLDDGLMAFGERKPCQDYHVTTYRITAAGRAYLKNHEHA